MQQQIPTLPEIDAESRAHCKRVEAHLRASIENAGGVLSFAQFMHEALYAPGLGYYAAGTKKLGRGGDFVTAPEVSPLFAMVLARQCLPYLRASRGADVVEIGAGSGRLAVDLLQSLEALDALPSRYRILEVSADLAARQRGLLSAEVPHLLPRIEWLDGMPADQVGVVIANEVLDALPVERFIKRKGEVRQLAVRIDDGTFGWCETEPSERLRNAVAAIETDVASILPDGFRSEVLLGVESWIGDVARSLTSGVVFLFDYGVTRREYYAPDRRDGWLRCHFRQHAHSNPFILTGIQDLSSWVDFTAVAEAAAGNGLDVLAFVTQAHFLLQGGVTEVLAGFSSLSTAAQLKLSAELKLLTLPDEMGEHFKCMILGRGNVDSPAAMQTVDRTARL